MSKGNVRSITIIAIVVLITLAWYSLIDSSVSETRQYNEYLKVAREKNKYEMYDDAQDNYLAALSMSDTIELRDEIAKFYQESGKTSNYSAFCEEIIKDYPYESIGYERLATYYKDTCNYYACFSLITTAEKRGVESKTLDKIVDELKFKYELTHVSFEDVQFFSAGLCAVKKTDGFWGYINPYGSTKISFSYEKANAFTSSGLAAVKNQKGNIVLIDTTNRTKFVDTEERNIEECTHLISGKIAVKYDGKYHYCDGELNELFGEYDYASAFSCGVAAVMNDGKWFIIDEKGKEVGTSKFDDIKVDDKGVAFRNNVAFAKKDGKYILIDIKGKKIGSESWDDADAFNSEEPAAVMKNNAWGYIDSSGKEVIKCQYAGAESFSNGLAAVQRKDKWGYIDLESKEEVIECSFAEARDFNDCGSTFVFSNDTWTLLKIYRLSKEK